MAATLTKKKTENRWVRCHIASGGMERVSNKEIQRLARILIQWQRSEWARKRAQL